MQILNTEMGSYVIHNFPFGIIEIHENKRKLIVTKKVYKNSSIYYMQKSYKDYHYYDFKDLTNQTLE